MTNIRQKFLIATFLLALGGLQTAAAATITASLGNTASGLADGAVPTTVELAAIQGGQPAPFDAGKGNEVLGPSLSESWILNYAPIAFPDVITSATLTLGIADHDSAASGSQLASYTIDGNDLTAPLDVLFEAGGGSGDGEYNVYTLSLGSSIFADLIDGSATIMLALQSPGIETCVLAILCGGNPTRESAHNGAHLIYSTLSIETQVIPIPAAAPLFASALILMGLFRRRVLRNEA